MCSSSATDPRLDLFWNALLIPASQYPLSCCAAVRNTTQGNCGTQGQQHSGWRPLLTSDRLRQTCSYNVDRVPFRFTASADVSDNCLQFCIVGNECYCALCSACGGACKGFDISLFLLRASFTALFVEGHFPKLLLLSGTRAT